MKTKTLRSIFAISFALFFIVTPCSAAVNNTYNILSDYASLAAALTAMGGSEGTLLVDRNETIASDTTIPSNVTVKFARGYKFSINTSVTLTVNGPVDAGLWQIFTGAGSVIVGTTSSDRGYVTWWGDTAAAAISAISSGLPTVVFDKNLLLTDEIIGASNVILEGENEYVTLTQTTAAKRILVFENKNNFAIRNLKLVGKGAQDGALANEELLVIYKCNNGIVERCYFSESRGSPAVGVDTSTDIKFINNEIKSFSYAGLQIVGNSQRVWVENNKIGDCKGLGSGYGIRISVGSAGDGSLYPKEVWVSDNYVYDVPSWDGISAQGGTDIHIVNNGVVNCDYGIELGLTYYNASSLLKDVFIIGNFVYGPDTDVGSSTYSGGINCIGAASQNIEDIIIANNTVKNASKFKTNKRGGISVGNARNVKISGNNCIANGYYGINLSANVDNFVIEGNSCINNQDIGIYLGYGNIKNGTVKNNIIRYISGLGGFVQQWGIGVGSPGSYNVSDYGNIINCNTDRYAGISTTWKREFHTNKPEESAWDIGDSVKLFKGVVYPGGPFAFICNNADTNRFVEAKSSVSGQVSFNNSETTKTITLDDPQPNTEYIVQVSIVATGGGPAIGIPYVLNITATSFEIHLTVAPGADKTVVVGWTLTRK